MDSTLIVNLVKDVMAPWTKQRKAEKRGRAQTRRDALVAPCRWTVKDAAWKVMKDAYLKASGGGRYPAAARQVYYAARGPILEITGRQELDSHYFTQKLLPEYIAAHLEQTESWDIIYDARGHLIEPHTELITPLGTLDVRGYLGDIREHTVKPVSASIDEEYPTLGPANRFGAVLFIEKEGFLPLFKAVRLAERFDIAVMSTKGMPVVACRALVDQLCGRRGIPLLVLHDFDKAGFSILGTLSGATHYDRDNYGVPPGTSIATPST